MGRDQLKVCPHLAEYKEYTILRKGPREKENKNKREKNKKSGTLKDRERKKERKEYRE